MESARKFNGVRDCSNPSRTSRLKFLGACFNRAAGRNHVIYEQYPGVRAWPCSERSLESRSPEFTWGPRLGPSCPCAFDQAEANRPNP
jgi:hypothetical protein